MYGRQAHWSEDIVEESDAESAYGILTDPDDPHDDSAHDAISGRDQGIHDGKSAIQRSRRYNRLKNHALSQSIPI